MGSSKGNEDKIIKKRPDTDFSSGPVKRRIIAQAVPLTVAQLVQLLYNVVDRIYIGHLNGIGDMALTGIGVAFPVIVIIAAFTSLCGSGGAALFSIARGRHDDEEAEKLLGCAFSMLLISSILLFAVCYPLRRPVLLLFGASGQSIGFAESYLGVYLFGTSFSMLATGLNGYINAQGFPRTGMLTTIIGAVVNIILDPIFIFWLNLGVSGAAIATVISQGLSAAWVLRFLTGKKAAVRIKIQNMRVHPRRALSIAAIGLPGFVMQGTNSLVGIVCNSQLQIYGGDLYVGVMTVLGSVREILSLPVLGLSNGAQPVLGYNYGAKENARVKEGIRFTAVLGVCYSLLAWAAVMLVPRQLMGIFTSSQSTVSTGAHMLNIYFFGFFFMAFQFVGQSTFQGLGRVKNAIFFSLFRKVIIVTPLTLLLPAMGFGAEGVFLAEPISNAIGGLACFITMWRVIYKKL